MEKIIMVQRKLEIEIYEDGSIYFCDADRDSEKKTLLEMTSEETVRFLKHIITIIEI